MNPTIVDQEILRDHAGDGMNGRELEEAIRECRPDVMALYTSGYTDNAIVHEGHLDPGMALMRKPCRKSDLSQKIREVLTGSLPY